MFRSDAREHRVEGDRGIGNTDNINLDVIAEIEKNLQDSPYDIISLVFLLYDVPDTALQRLIVYQRVSKDIGSSNMNLLHEWYRYANSKPTWKHEFLEALLICQLYGIVKKLNFDIPTVKRYYQPDRLDVKMYINPMKKALYAICENINSVNFVKLKKSLVTYGINTMEHESCELVLLDLMCQKFITFTQYQYNQKMAKCEFNIENLAKILDKLSGLKVFVNNLRDLVKNEVEENKSVPGSSTPVPAVTVDDPHSQNKNEEIYTEGFDDVFRLLNEMNLEEPLRNLKSDTIKNGKDFYKIKNPKKMGVCIIINQEDFYPSKGSIENYNQTEDLDSRRGSSIDKNSLKRTMTMLNFNVISHKNLTHKEIFECIQADIKSNVTEEDSIFILCLLSHGVRGHIFAADSVKVKVEDIQSMLDSDTLLHLRGIPKVLIIQACQIDDKPGPTLVADSNITNYYLRKSDFLIYWATAPEYEAYRDENRGTLFIQILCRIIEKKAKVDHLYDIFTTVTNRVTNLCSRLKKVQVPIFESTLRKKLYLQFPQP